MAYRPQGTIVPAPGFNAQNDASALRTAMKGLGTDEKAIIAVLAHRTSEQRQQISTAFKTLYGKDLIADLKSELQGNLEDVTLALMQDRFTFEAHCLRNAMKGAGTDEGVLVELICTKMNDEIAALKAAYTKAFQRDLEKDIVSETGGYFKRLLVSLLQGARPLDGPIDQARVAADARALHEAGEKQFGTDESKFNEIIVGRPFWHARLVFEEYQKIAGRSILRSIDNEMNGPLAEGFKAVVLSILDRPTFFAEKLYKSMHGAGTDDTTLIRVIVTRSEIDLADVKKAFLAKYQKSLAKMISDDCGGDYKRMLVAIVGE